MSVKSLKADAIACDNDLIDEFGEGIINLRLTGVSYILGSEYVLGR